MFILLISILILLIIGVPIGMGFALSSFLGAGLLNIPLETLSSVPYQAVTSFPLLAIPFFILAGQIMNQGNLIGKLVDLAEMFLYWLKGMLGYVTIISSAFIGAISGSSVATVAAVGSIIGNRMIDKGYKRGYVAALTGACGLLGVLIPPSISLIVYGTAVGVSIADLFLATIVPGALMILAFLIVHFLLLNKVLDKSSESRTNKDDKELDSSLVFVQQGRWMTVKKALPVVVMPVIILGGIYGGIFTPTEAAAVAAVYGLLVALIGKTLKVVEIPEVFYKSGLTAIAILVIISFTSVFNKILILEQIPQNIAEYTTAFTSNKIIFLLLVTLVLLLVGMFMETNAAVLLMGPLLAPAAIQFGINPIHFGILLVTNIELGLITPPLAANLYVAAKANNASVVQMIPYVAWFFIASVFVLIMITYIPMLSIWFM